MPGEEKLCLGGDAPKGEEVGRHRLRMENRLGTKGEKSGGQR